jgi:uncharacterized protein
LIMLMIQVPNSVSLVVMSEDSTYFDKLEQLLDKTGLLSTEDRHLINEIRKDAEVAQDRGDQGAEFLEEEEEAEKEKEPEKESSDGEAKTPERESRPKEHLKEHQVFLTISPDHLKEHQVFLTISPDHLEAHMTIIPHAGFSIDRETVEAMLTRRGIRSGISWEAVEAAITRANAGMVVTGHLIAKGTAPIEGQDALVHYYFEQKKSPRSNDQSVPKKRSKIAHYVRRGRMIAEKIPLVTGVNGLDLKARAINCKRVEDNALVPGKNTTMDDQGRLYSMVDGRPNLDVSGVITVIPIFAVDGDVDLSVGDIKFSGDVEIFGNVMPGFIIEADGDVNVKGAVEGARIFSKGNINVRGGFTGGKKGLIKAGGDCFLGHCNTGMLEVMGDLNIDKELLNATVYTSGDLKVKGKGALIGGQIFVGKHLEVHNMGSNFGVNTSIHMGQKELVHRRLKKVFAKKREREKQIDLIQRAMRRLKLQEDSLTLNEAVHKKILVELVESQQSFHRDLEEINKEIQRLNEMKSRFTVHFVRVKGTIFPGVRVAIGQSVLDVPKKMNRKEFYEDPNHRAIMYRSYSGTPRI